MLRTEVRTSDIGHIPATVWSNSYNNDTSQRYIQRNPLVQYMDSGQLALVFEHVNYATRGIRS